MPGKNIKMRTDMEAYKHKIQYYETDKMGVTHHSNYIRWMEEARVYLLDGLGFSYKKLEESGIISPVTNVECKFVHSTTFDELISIKVYVEEVKNVKIKIAYVMTNEEGKIVCKGKSEHCFLDVNGGFINISKKMPDFYEVLLANQSEEVQG